MECLICISPIATPQFIPPNPLVEKPEDCVDKQDIGCLRLGCGHAFHSECITSAFRRGIGCPTCRETLLQTTHTVQVSLDLEDEEEEEETEPMYLIMDAKRSQLRTCNNNVKSARHLLNIQLRKYRVLAEKLRMERRDVIRKALKPLNTDRKAEFNAAYSNVQSALQKVMHVEKNELHKLGGEISAFSEQYFKEIKNSDYNPKELVSCSDYLAPDPIHKKFWKG